MDAVCLHDKTTIEHYLRQNTFLHLYAIGDLDDFFWPHTTWYALQEQVALLYSGEPLPVLLALSDEAEKMQALLRALLPLLPARFYAHLSAGIAGVLTENYHIHSHGAHYKMGLINPACLDSVDTETAVHLTMADAEEVEAFYRVSCPGNWFTRRMLETGCNYGMRQDGQLVSVAGVHVYSPHYRVAALGNIATHPDYRRRGLATIACARLCCELLPTVDYIALNVRADNAGAIACYERLGFAHVADYCEYTVELI